CAPATIDSLFKGDKTRRVQANLRSTIGAMPGLHPYRPENGHTVHLIGLSHELLHPLGEGLNRFLNPCWSVTSHGGPEAAHRPGFDVLRVHAMAPLCCGQSDRPAPSERVVDGQPSGEVDRGCVEDRADHAISSSRPPTEHGDGWEMPL